jgi:hypothetical protein
MLTSAVETQLRPDIQRYSARQNSHLLGNSPNAIQICFPSSPLFSVLFLPLRNKSKTKNKTQVWLKQQSACFANLKP